MNYRQQDQRPRLLSQAAFGKILKVTQRTLRRLELSDPAFPRRLQLSRKLIYYVASEVLDYIRGAVDSRPYPDVTARHCWRR
jgi:hypothetical protein